MQNNVDEKTQTYTDQIGQVRNVKTGAIITPNAQENKPAIPTYGYAKPVSLISTQNGIDTVKKADEKLAKISPPPVTTPTTTTEKPKEITTPQGQEDYITLINENGQKQTFYNPSLNKSSIQNLLNSGYSISESKMSQAFDLNGSSSSSSTNQLDTAKAELDTARANLEKNLISDAELQGQIATISANWDSKIAEMKRINESRQKAYESMGIRLGSQYTGGIKAGSSFGGVISEEENQGLQRISDLEVKKQEAIALAKEAQRTNNWKVYDKQVSIAEEAYNEKVKAVTELNKKVAEETNKLKEKGIQATRDSAIANLFTQGVTDPVKMLSLLNANGGDFTAKEIGDAFTTFTGKSGDSLPTLGKEFEYMKKYMPEGSTPFDYLRMKNNAERKAVAAGGGTDVSFDQFSNESIALSAIPTTLRNSEVELKRYLDGIRLGLKSGKTPYEIADTLMGYKILTPDNFSNGLRPYIGLANLEGAEIGEVSRLVNNKQYDKAISKIENKIYQKAKTASSDNYVDEANVIFATQKSNEIKNKIDSLGSNAPVGIVSGTMEQWLRRLKGKDAQIIQQSVVSLVADMRNRLSGTAVTEGEKVFLDPLIPDLKDTPANFMSKLSELKNAPLQRLNSVRSQYELPTLDESTLLDRNKRIPLYSASSNIVDDTQNTTVDVQGKTYDTTKTYIDGNNVKWKVDANGTWTKV